MLIRSATDALYELLAMVLSMITIAYSVSAEQGLLERCPIARACILAFVHSVGMWPPLLYAPCDRLPHLVWAGQSQLTGHAQANCRRGLADASFEVSHRRRTHAVFLYARRNPLV
jgi:hypothetical protein